MVSKHETLVGQEAPQGVTSRPSRRARRSAWSGKHSSLRILLRNAGSALLLMLIIAALWPANLGGVTGFTVVQGQSMEPTYVTGDLVMTLQQPAYEVGDVITYLVPEGQPGAGGRVIHRIIEQRETADQLIYVTQGDNNVERDPWVIGPDHIVGHALWHIPGLGQILGARSYPLIIAGAAATIVLIFLWPSRKKTEDAE